MAIQEVSWPPCSKVVRWGYWNKILLSRIMQTGSRRLSLQNKSILQSSFFDNQESVRLLLWNCVYDISCLKSCIQIYLWWSTFDHAAGLTWELADPMGILYGRTLTMQAWYSILFFISIIRINMLSYNKTGSVVSPLQIILTYKIHNLKWFFMWP